MGTEELAKNLKILDKDTLMQIFEYKLETANSLTEVMNLGDKFATSYKFGKENFFNQGGLRLMIMRLWKILLKYKQNISYGYLETPLTNFNVIETFLDTLFTVKVSEYRLSTIHSWNKYRIIDSIDGITFITNDGEVHKADFLRYRILSFAYTTLYFAVLVNHTVFIYLDRPWDISKYAFVIKVDYRADKIRLIETMEGLMLVLIIPISPFISRSEVYKVNFDSNNLELMRKISQSERTDEEDITFVYYGSFMLLENRTIKDVNPPIQSMELSRYDSEEVYDSEEILTSEKIPNRMESLQPTGIVGYDMIRLGNSHFIMNSNREIIFKFTKPPGMFFDFFYIKGEGNKILIGETMTGRLLKVYQLNESIEKFPGGFAMTRKDNGTGYYIWLTS